MMSVALQTRPRAFAACEQGSMERFLQAMTATSVLRGSSTLRLMPPHGDSAVIVLMR